MKVIPAEKFMDFLKSVSSEVYQTSMNFYAMSMLDEIKEIAEDLTIEINPPANCSTWNKGYMYRCNNCRRSSRFCFRFCPECGARMENGVKQP